MYKDKELSTMTVKSGLFAVACAAMLSLSGCETCQTGKCSSGTSEGRSSDTQGSSHSGGSLSQGQQTMEDVDMLTGTYTSGEPTDSLASEDASDSEEVKSSDESAQPDPGSSTDIESGSTSSTPGDVSSAPEDADDLMFRFTVSGASQAFDARVRGGVAGSSIVIDKFPEKYLFRPSYGTLPQRYPDAMNAEFCSKIEGRVETVEKGNTASELARSMLRESYPFVILHFSFGSPLTTELFVAAREAAKSAGALSPNLQIANGPKFQDVELDVTFAENSLTRRMGDHEAARKEFQKQLAEGGVSPHTGSFPGGTNWPDLLCDLYTKRAQVKMTFKEEGWSGVSLSQTIVQER